MATENVIRLTESDLHEIINETVNEVLNEIQFGGEEFHGNKPEDWAAMSDLRFTMGDVNKDIYDHGTGGKRTGQYDDDFDSQRREHNWKGIDDRQNAQKTALSRKELSQALVKGKSKANRVKRNMLKKYMNQPK